jgi:hypothetical protein
MVVVLEMVIGRLLGSPAKQRDDGGGGFVTIKNIGRGGKCGINRLVKL